MRYDGKTSAATEKNWTSNPSLGFRAFLLRLQPDSGCRERWTDEIKREWTGKLSDCYFQRIETNKISRFATDGSRTKEPTSSVCGCRIKFYLQTGMLLLKRTKETLQSSDIIEINNLPEGKWSLSIWRLLFSFSDLVHSYAQTFRFALFSGGSLSWKFHVYLAADLFDAAAAGEWQALSATVIN